MASLGNDIVLDDLLSRTENKYLPGTRNIILSKEGRLIVDSHHQADPKALQVSRSIDPLRDPILQDVLEKAYGMTTPIALTQTIDPTALPVSPILSLERSLELA